MKRFCMMVLASLLIVTALPTMASANSGSVINIAHGYIGTPYAYGGTTSSGFDCSGFTQRVFSDAGSSLPRTTGGQFGVGAAVDKGNLQAGDLVFFNTSGKGVSHVGIYIGSNNFIHSSSSKGVMISSINDPYYWGSRYIGARRPGGQPAAQPQATAPEKKEEKKEEKKAEPKVVKAAPKKENKPAKQKKAEPQQVTTPVAQTTVEPEVIETVEEPIVMETPEAVLLLTLEMEELLDEYIEYTFAHLEPKQIRLIA